VRGTTTLCITSPGKYRFKALASTRGKNKEERFSSVTRSGEVRLIPKPRMVHYEIRVFSGDLPTAGTDANVACVLIGRRDDKTRTLQLEHKARVWHGWERWLRTPLKFSRTREQVIVVCAEDVGEVPEVHLWHDNTYLLQSPNFYLHRIGVWSTTV
jgi:hypothetical protein